MVSIDGQLKRVHALVGTNDLSEWEQDFVESLWEFTREGKDTTRLSERQLDVLERLFNKHFSG